MASQGVGANSKLTQLQMRFQQKQLQEREQKKLALTTVNVTNTQAPASARNAIGNGKVREMFDSRRRGVGIDRSHPLKPISSTSTISMSHSKSVLNQQQAATMRRAAVGSNSQVTTRRTINNNKQASSYSMHNSHSHPDDFVSKGGSNLFGSGLDEMDNLESETFPKEFSSLSLDNTRIMGASIHDGNNNLNKTTNGIGRRDIMDTTITGNPRSLTNGIKLNPLVVKKSPNTQTGSKTSRSGIVKQRSASGTTARTPATARLSTSTNGPTTTATTANKSPAVKRSTTTTAATTTTKGAKTTTKGSSHNKPTTFVLAVKPPPRVVTPPPGMANCQYCQRNFNEERLEKHQEVCRKMTAKKRKVFDASKHRVQGTEAEKYVKKVAGKSSTSTVGAQKSVNANNNNVNNTAADGKKPDWRKKHEEFINAIREAKKVQAFLAKGGKLSDLPPPTPSENPDYIQCPHCSRRFNETAAERHIPKCANMKHNKPKPPVQKKRY